MVVFDDIDVVIINMLIIQR